MNENITRNALETRFYVFSKYLHNNLESSVSSNPKDSFKKTGNKHPDGIYIVMFRVLNLKTNVLVYNYMYYPNYFFMSLLTYL